LGAIIVELMICTIILFNLLLRSDNEKVVI